MLSKVLGVELQLVDLERYGKGIDQVYLHSAFIAAGLRVDGFAGDYFIRVHEVLFPGNRTSVPVAAQLVHRSEGVGNADGGRLR